MKRDPAPYTQYELDKPRTDNLRTIIANLVDNPDGLQQMGEHRLEPDTIPQALVFEELVLRAIYHCSHDGLEPNRENILTLVSYDDRLKLSDEQLAHRLESLITYRTDPPLVRAAAYGLGEWIKKRKIRAVIDKGSNQIDQYGTATDFWYYFLAMLRQASPMDLQKGLVFDTDLFETFLTDLDRRAGMSMGGISPGPTTPWASLNKYLDPMEIGEILSIIVLSGGGKTNILHQIANHLAYRIGGYDFLFCHTETKSISLKRRDLIRTHKIPGYALKSGVIRHNGKQIPVREYPPFQQVETGYRKFLEKVFEHKGRIMYEHCPGLTITSLSSMIDQAKILAEQAGRELVVGVDYLQAMSHETLESAEETRKNNQNADDLKKLVDDKGVYGIITAQDQPNPSYDGNVNPYEGKRIITRSQQAIQVQRKRATDDDDLIRFHPTEAGQHMTDFLGNEIFWHKGGSWHSDMTFYVFKNNEGMTGKTTLRSCNAFYEIVDPGNPH